MTIMTRLKSTTGMPLIIGFVGLTASFAIAACSESGENPDAVSRDMASSENACNPCNPCNPCASGEACVVPRIAAAYQCNPCAAAKCGGCNPCNPCAAAKCGGCNACNPCNPCAAAKCGGCNPCNPCAAAKCGGCNPCNPCGGCNPCNPCGAGGGVELTDAEADAAYDCIKAQVRAAFANSDIPGAVDYMDWTSYNTVPYTSGTHGGRFVNNYANATAGNYGRFEDVGTLPVGSILAKDSMTVGNDGKVMVGPLFMMEKMPTGFHAESGDWKYSMAMPDGSTFGVTNGKNSGGMQFCIDCHAVMEDQDHLFFMPDDYRKNGS